jgi:uncharacterized membrane protein
MTPANWASLIVAIIALVTAFAGAVRWLVKHYLYELKSNGGSSIKDSVKINTERLTRVEERVDDIYLILCKRGPN